MPKEAGRLTSEVPGKVQKLIACGGGHECHTTGGKDKNR